MSSPPTTAEVEPTVDSDLIPSASANTHAAAANPKSKNQKSRFPQGLHRYTLLAGLLIVFVGLVTFVAPTDPDVWWHLRNGKLILDSGVPSHDVYSFTAQGRPWLVQEWLTEVVMYGLK